MTSYWLGGDGGGGGGEAAPSFAAEVVKLLPFTLPDWLKDALLPRRQKGEVG